MPRESQDHSRDLSAKPVATPLMVLAGAVLSVLLALWIQDAHFLQKAGNPAESVPPALAVALILLVGLVAHLVGLRPKRPEMFFLYITLFVAAHTAGIGLVDRFIIMITLLPYRAPEDPVLADYAADLPAWWSPASSSAIIDFFEGTGSSVPWGPWLPVLGFWTLFLGLLFFWMFTLMVMIRRQWVDRERLVFPLADLPARFAGDEERRPFYRLNLFWLGVGIAAFFHAFFILNHYFPLLPGLSKSVGFNFGVDRPWVALNWPPNIGFNISFTVIGLAFLVNQEMNFSIWITFLAIKFFHLFRSAAGFSNAPFPNQNALVGGGFTIAVFCLWLARKHLVQVARKALGMPTDLDDTGEAVSYRVAFFGFLFATLGLAGLLIASGASLILVLVVLGFLLVLVIAMARIRAEAGTPIVWLVPWAGTGWFSYFTNMAGPGVFSHRDVVLGSVLNFLTVGFFPLMGATQMESLRLADDVGVKKRSMGVALHLGFFVAFFTGMISLLYLFYLGGGANSLAEYETTVFYGFFIFLKEVAVAEEAKLDGLPWFLGGSAMTTALIILRYTFLRFPIHPVGFILAQTYAGRWMMGGVFFAWLIKALVLKYGGVKVFRKLVPLFVGLAVGEVATVGLWFLIVRFIPGESYALTWG